MKILHGSDICSVQTGVIIHQCNAQGKMNSGVAKALRLKYPKIWESYSRVVDPSLSADHGSSFLGLTIAVKVAPELFIVNAVAQQFYGKDGRKYTSYDALDRCLMQVSEDFPDEFYHLPMIGCGLGGGKWEVVQEIIKHRLDANRVTIHIKNNK